LLHVRIGLVAVEATDEELAAAVVGGDVLTFLGWEDWRRLLAVDGRARLLRAVEQADGALPKGWLAKAFERPD
jgi:hypothetical protein